MSEVDPYWVLAGFLVAAVLFALLPLALARGWAVHTHLQKPGLEKNAPYECGLVSSGDAWGRMRVDYYIYAIIFLIFDVEVLFLLPFAVAFTGLPVGALVAMLVFILLLAEGLVWAWQRGHLEWK